MAEEEQERRLIDMYLASFREAVEEVNGETPLRDVDPQDETAFNTWAGRVESRTRELFIARLRAARAG